MNIEDINQIKSHIKIWQKRINNGSLDKADMLNMINTIDSLCAELVLANESSLARLKLISNLSEVVSESISRK